MARGVSNHRPVDTKGHWDCTPIPSKNPPQPLLLPFPSECGGKEWKRQDIHPEGYPEKRAASVPHARRSSVADRWDSHFGHPLRSRKSRRGKHQNPGNHAHTRLQNGKKTRVAAFPPLPFWTFLPPPCRNRGGRKCGRCSSRTYINASNCVSASLKEAIAASKASFLVRSTPASFRSSTGLSEPPEERNRK